MTSDLDDSDTCSSKSGKKVKSHNQAIGTTVDFLFFVKLLQVIQRALSLVYSFLLSILVGFNS